MKENNYLIVAIFAIISLAIALPALSPAISTNITITTVGVSTIANAAHRNETTSSNVTVHAIWNQTINGSHLMYDPGAIGTFVNHSLNYTSNTSCVSGCFQSQSSTTTNYTIRLNYSWVLGAHTLRIIVNSTTVDASAIVYNETPAATFNVWDWMGINDDVRLNATINNNDAITFYCSVVDLYNSSGLGGVTVSFYNGATSLGSVTTNATGWAAKGPHTFSAGTYNIACNITASTSLYLNVSDASEWGILTVQSTGGGGTTPDVVQNPPSVQVSENKVTVIFPTIGAGQTKTQIIDRPQIVIVTELALTAKLDVTNNFVVVIQHTIPASTTASPSGTVYKYIDVGKSGITDAAVSQALLTFAVEKSWISTNNIDKTTVKMQRYTTQWDTLDTTLTREDDTYVYYQTPSLGLSLFAVTGETITTAPGPTTQPTQLPTNWIVIIIVVIVVLVLAWYGFGRGRRSK